MVQCPDLDVRSSWLHCVRKQGFLVRRGRLVHSWSRRYFVLVHNLLYYFHAPDEKPAGVICLDDAVVDVREPMDGRVHLFQITTRVDRIFTFQAASQEEAVSWVEAIRAADVAALDASFRAVVKSRVAAAADAKRAVDRLKRWHAEATKQIHLDIPDGEDPVQHHARTMAAMQHQFNRLHGVIEEFDRMTHFNVSSLATAALYALKHKPTQGSGRPQPADTGPPPDIVRSELHELFASSPEHPAIRARPAPKSLVTPTKAASEAEALHQQALSALTPLAELSKPEPEAEMPWRWLRSAREETRPVREEGATRHLRFVSVTEEEEEGGAVKLMTPFIGTPDFAYFGTPLAEAEDPGVLAAEATSPSALAAASVAAGAPAADGAAAFTPLRRGSAVSATSAAAAAATAGGEATRRHRVARADSGDPDIEDDGASSPLSPQGSEPSGGDGPGDTDELSGIMTPDESVDASPAPSEAARDAVLAQLGEYGNDSPRIVLEVLCGSDPQLLTSLLSDLPAPPPNLAQSLVFLCARGGSTCWLKLLQVCSQNVVSTSEHASCLFRRDTTASKVLRQVAQLVATNFVQEALEPVLMDVCATRTQVSPLELDAERVRETLSASFGSAVSETVLRAAVQQNVDSLCAMFGSLVSCVLAALSVLPASLRYVCSSLAAAAETTLGEGSGVVAIQGFLFLRLLTPLLVNPQSFHGAKMPTPAAPGASRSLMLLAKLLQAVVNDSGLQDNSLFSMLPEQWVTKQRHTLQSAMLDLCTPMVRQNTLITGCERDLATVLLNEETLEDHTETILRTIEQSANLSHVLSFLKDSSSLVARTCIVHLLDMRARQRDMSTPHSGRSGRNIHSSFVSAARHATNHLLSSVVPSGRRR